MHSFDDIQSTLPAAFALNSADSATTHTVVVLPSFSVGETLLSHYASRLGALEHRFLLAILLLRLPAVRIVYVCSQTPDERVVDLYLSLLPDELVAGARDRLSIVVVDDPSARPVAAKLLDRPDVIASIRAWVGDSPAYIEPWNVTALEMRLALELQLPINGTPPELWPLAFKSAGRTLMRDAGVPVPPGFEDLHSVDDAVRAIDRLRLADPALEGVVLKHDDSGAGDGNAVIDLDGLAAPGSSMAQGQLRSRINRLDADYVAELGHGFVVEAMIAGAGYASPSAQVDIHPDGSVSVLSTHEQILDDSGQVYLGCRLPADPAHAVGIAGHALAVGRALAARGALGRLAVDFVTVADGGGASDAYALEINLRRGGTSHPFAVLRHLAPGAYDAQRGEYVDDRGQVKHYVATDNLVDERWTGRREGEVIDALAAAGILFDRRTRTGIVPHMLSCLAVDGRFGFTAIGDTLVQAAQLHEATRTTMDTLVSS